MNEDLSDRYRITVGILCFLAFAVLFAAFAYVMANSSDNGVRLPLLVITGVMVLFATLALVAVTFSVAGLSDPSQALGLPEGSVRAAIALSLIVIFATMIFVHSGRLSPPQPTTQVVQAGQSTPQPAAQTTQQPAAQTTPPPAPRTTPPPAAQTTPPPAQTTPPPGQTTPGQTTPPPGQTSAPPGQTTPPPGQTSALPAQTIPPPDDFEKQVISIVGTLMTSVVSFYFAARASSAAPAARKSKPVLASVSPAQVTKGAAATVVPLQITGTDLQLASSVKLQKDRVIILASSVVSNEQLVKCDVTIAPTTSPARYDVVVTTSDDQTASLAAAFEVVAG